MKVSVAKVILTEEDILSIAQDYLKIEGLNIENITIQEMITIEGIYKKKINTAFEVKLGLGNIKYNIINLKIFDLKVHKLKIFKGVKNIAIKKILEDFSPYGVNVDGDNIIVDLNLAVKLIPYFNLKLNRIEILPSALQIEAENIKYEKEKKFPHIEKKRKNVLILDKYHKLRKKIVHKVPPKYEKIVEYGMLVPDIIVLFWRLLKDKRVNLKVKTMLTALIAYLASPIDLVPDFIPFIGKIDDIAIAFFALNIIVDEIPEKIITDNWQGEENIILITKEVVNYTTKILGSKNISKILEQLQNIFKSRDIDNCKN
ncbi:YkvA family protein [Clostridium sp. Mt-5]|uniref:YkvA family protein n=1 Tax=Clostridium moutaii TaxID=3240932 RepID=A0ABV4BUE3_9CLOT